MAARGIRTSAIRLSPIVHGAGDQGFARQLIQIVGKKESAYVGNGQPKAFRAPVDASRLFRLALEKGPAGGTYHYVTEEGVAFRDIAGLMDGA